jgi:hypothetical protein
MRGIGHKNMRARSCVAEAATEDPVSAPCNATPHGHWLARELSAVHALAQGCSYEGSVGQQRWSIYAHREQVLRFQAMFDVHNWDVLAVTVPSEIPQQQTAVIGSRETPILP